MKTLLGLLVIGTVTTGQTVNPQRFTAATISYESDIAQLRGNVLMKITSAIIRAEGADFDKHKYIITIHGNSRWNLLPVRSQPDFNADYITNPRPVTDPARLHASEIHKDGDVISLHGKVEMMMPGMRIEAEDVEINQSTATLDVRGDCRVIFLKARLEPDDNLGPLFL